METLCWILLGTVVAAAIGFELWEWRESKAFTKHLNELHEAKRKDGKR